MSDLTVHFDTSDSGAFKLLELPPELCKLVEDAAVRPKRFCIKGSPNEDAVLCTDNKTYAVRSVDLSNTVMVVSSSKDIEKNVVVRDELHDILELMPCLPRLHVLDQLLLGLEYGEDTVLDEDAEIDDEEMDLRTLKPVRRKHMLTYEDARNRVQASDAELQLGLAQKHILQLQGHLYPISSSYLSKILELLLNTVVSLSLRHQAAPVEELSLTLEQEHEVKREVTTQVMSWFGTIEASLWNMNAKAVLSHVGLSILSTYEHEAVLKEVFLCRWAETVGDAFVADVKLDLIAGNYIELPTTSSFDEEKITYYPRSALPIDPAARFGDLFNTRARWKAEEIEPFLTDIAVDKKERDKLLLKYARAITDNGVWYTARAKYNG